MANFDSRDDNTSSVRYLSNGMLFIKLFSFLQSSSAFGSLLFWLGKLKGKQE